jgi:endonuclease YncB( thermonuclease family)
MAARIASRCRRRAAGGRAQRHQAHQHDRRRSDLERAKEATIQAWHPRGRAIRPGPIEPGLIEGEPIRSWLPRAGPALLAAILALALLGGCGRAGPRPPALRTPTAERASWPRSPAGAVPAVVAQVVDGDTFVAVIGGRRDPVRVIGVDTPETVAPGRPVEPYGKQASTFARYWLDRATVRLAGDVEPRDRYGRLLAYVWLADGTFWNALLAAEGYAEQLTIPPNVAFAELFERLVAQARTRRHGLWAGDQPGAAGNPLPTGAGGNPLPTGAGGNPLPTGAGGNLAQPGTARDLSRSGVALDLPQPRTARDLSRPPAAAAVMALGRRRTPTRPRGRRGRRRRARRSPTSPRVPRQGRAALPKLPRGHELPRGHGRPARSAQAAQRPTTPAFSGRRPIAWTAVGLLLLPT